MGRDSEKVKDAYQTGPRKLEGTPWYDLDKVPLSDIVAYMRTKDYQREDDKTARQICRAYVQPIETNESPEGTSEHQYRVFALAKAHGGVSPKTLSRWLDSAHAGARKENNVDLFGKIISEKKGYSVQVRELLNKAATYSLADKEGRNSIVHNLTEAKELLVLVANDDAERLKLDIVKMAEKLSPDERKEVGWRAGIYNDERSATK
jgi:hypothetical protein